MNPDNPKFRTAEDWEKLCARLTEEIAELKDQLKTIRKDYEGLLKYCYDCSEDKAALKKIIEGLTKNE